MPKRVSGSSARLNFYKIEIKDTWISLKMLEDTGYFKGKFKNNKPCCISAYLRGAFLGQGGAKNFEFIKPFKLISICYWDY